MTPERWEVIQRVLEAVIELEPTRRAAFLDDACLGDPSLRPEVESLLAANEAASTFFKKLPLEAPSGLAQSVRFLDSEVISQRYRIVRFIAKGGMGEVYEALDLELNFPVALKTLLPDGDRSGAAIARFKREIQLARQVTHPNVCRVYDMGRCQHASERDVPYLTMEFLKGETLARRIARAGRLSTDTALPLARQMASALGAAHRLGIIHRDFKTSNVMLVPNGSGDCVKVTDFGLARSVSTKGKSELTISGQVMGTPAYMAPEQFRGKATVASDIYALGVVMYEMVTGERPRQADGGAAGRPAPGPRTLIPDLDARWDRTIQKCMKLDPAERFSNVEDVGIALGGTTLPATKTYPWGRNPRWRFGLRLAIGGTALILALAAFALRDRIGRIRHPIPEQKHIAVLPFRNIGNDPSSQAFCEGLVESLTSNLSQLERYQKSFWVVPSSDARSAKNLDEAYRKLNVTLVVTGSMQRTAGGVELVANLIDARTHKMLDSKRISTSSSEIESLQQRAWERVADMLDVQIGPEMVRALDAGGTRVPGAFEFYEQGLGYVKRYDLDQIEQAIGLFQKALAKDPNYALAYAGLADAYSKKYAHTKDREFIDKARWNGRRAVELDDALASVHLALGNVYVRTGQLDDAIKEFRRTLEADPAAIDAYFYLGEAYAGQGKFDLAEENFKTVVNRRSGYWLGHSGLGQFEYAHGRYSEAAEQFRILIELQPDNSLGYQNLGAVRLVQCNYDEAIAVFRRGVERKPTAEIWSNLGSTYLLQGNYNAAAPAMKIAVDLSPKDDVMWRNLGDSYRWIPSLAGSAPAAYRRARELGKARLAVDPNNALSIASIALYDAHLGLASEARANMTKAVTKSPGDDEILFTAALVYEIIGERRQALTALDKAWRAGYSLCIIEKEPELASLRDDSRYRQWVRKAARAAA
jgi:serine/threonine protein kinase/Tfp pilus assembly protein PilF